MIVEILEYVLLVMRLFLIMLAIPINILKEIPLQDLFLKLEMILVVIFFLDIVVNTVIERVCIVTVGIMCAFSGCWHIPCVALSFHLFVLIVY